MEKANSSKMSGDSPLSRMTVPLTALILAPIAMGASPVFVRLAEVGPYTSAFWRVGLALPLLLLWWYWERRANASACALPSAKHLKSALWAGLFFAGDLFFWHLSIVNTTVANATFFATLAPIAVVIGAGLFLREKVSANLVIGLCMAIFGACFLIGSSLTQAPDRVLGDIYGMVTAVFFAAYMLSIKAARRTMPAGELMFFSTCVTAAVLFMVAIGAEDRLLPQTWQGFGSLFSLAVVSQVGGQGLLAFALGHLPATFSSIVVFLEPLAAAGLGWLVLDEALSGLQTVGGVLILAGILIARPKR